MKVIVTGGAGYVGSRLVPQLLAAGYHVVIYDIGYFGWGHIQMHPRLKIVIGDIRNVESLSRAVRGCDAFIHLAAVSNDASFELNPELSRTTNFDCFEPLVLASKKAGVQRFIYASSSSVYGVSESKNVTEEHPLVPLTLYNKLKGDAEPLLFKHQDENFTCVTIRPATVCGYSPRMRLDLSVNILTNHAFRFNKITVFGGSQMRPNLHIQDMCDLYQMMLEAPKEKVAGETFNVGNENYTILQLAEIVRNTAHHYGRKPIEIETTPSNDLRSYHISSEKIKRVLEFDAQYNVKVAVAEMMIQFWSGNIPNSMEDSKYYNVRKMKELNAK